MMLVSSITTNASMAVREVILRRFIWSTSFGFDRFLMQVHGLSAVRRKRPPLGYKGGL
jgi:hypothetical protein